MKKRVLAALLCAAMTATLLVGCGGETGNTESQKPSTETEKESGSEKETGSESNGGEEVKLSVDPVVHYTFDSTDENWKVVIADAGKTGNNAYDISLTTGSRGIIDGKKEDVQIIDGAVDKCIYLNGYNALDLNFAATNTDAWSVSFWVYADRMVNFGPTLQMGSNIGMADGNGVTWLNVTQANWDGTNDFPLLWSRNENYNVDANTCWPWMYAFDGQQLVGQWVMVTIVDSGETYTGVNGATYTGAQLYVNGELKYDSLDNFNNGTYFEYKDWDATMAPGIMKPAEGQTFEAYFGINYWDLIFKGCLDDFYVFDKAITADDVKALYATGDATVTPQPNRDDDVAGPQDNPKPLLQNGVGKNDYSQGWWTTWSDIWEVKEGETKTVTYKNYHTALGFQNYFNSAIILQNTPTGHSAVETDANYAAGYAEYLVARLDNFAWKGAVNTGTEGHGLCTLENNWPALAEGGIDSAAFNTATHGANVVLTVTNNGSTADVVFTLTAQDGNVYTQSYKGIAIDGPLYFCLTVEKACIDIVEVK